MKKLNLLPHHILEKQQHKKLYVLMATLSVAIFLCAGIWWAYLHKAYNTSTYRLQHYSAPLNEAALNAAIKRDQLQIAYAGIQNFVLENFPPTFCHYWVTAITNSAPHGLSIESMHYTGGAIAVMGTATHIIDLGNFRDAIINTGLFANATHGTLSGVQGAQANENFTFIINIMVAENE